MENGRSIIAEAFLSKAFQSQEPIVYDKSVKEIILNSRAHWLKVRLTLTSKILIHTHIFGLTASFQNVINKSIASQFYYSTILFITFQKIAIRQKICGSLEIWLVRVSLSKCHLAQPVQYEFFEVSSVEKFARAIQKFDFSSYGVKIKH